MPKVALGLPWEQSGPFGYAVLAASIAVIIWYFNAQAHLLADHGRSWSRLKTASFTLGIATAAASMFWPMPILAMDSFTGHVMQHILVMNVAPVLIAVGTPMKLLLQGSDRNTQVRVLHVLRSRTFKWIHFPPLVWFCFYASMFVFFLGGNLLGVMAPGNQYQMDLVNLIFLLLGLLFWIPSLGLDPTLHWRIPVPYRVLVVILGVPINTILGLALSSMKMPIAPMYSLSTTLTGGETFWGVGELFTIVPLFILFRQWTTRERENETPLKPERLINQPTHKSNGEEITIASSQWELLWTARHGTPPPTHSEP